jgi:hypothetical protein
MLIVPGEKHRHCDGVSRRNFLRIGSLAMGGLTLPDLLRAEAASGIKQSNKSVIMIFLSGGPPHQDMVDLKPEAPVEVRGEFEPISTNVPGIQIGDQLPLLAKMTDKLAIIRSVVGSEGRHAGFQCMTGQRSVNQPQGGWPSLGSAISKLRGPTTPSMPPFVSLVPPMKGKGWSDPGQPGFLGIGHQAFRPTGDCQADMVLNDITPDRLHDRHTLLTSLDRFRREADASGAMAGLDRFNEQALGILTSSKLAEALDLTRESQAVRDRYGYGSPEPAGYGDAGPLLNTYFLSARRLIEAGARVVTLAYGRWDWHGRPYGTTFENSRHHMPMLDQGLTALLDDLHERGLDKDTTVVVWGEFGRTPKINANVGRDHWPNVSFALFSGGGLRTGQVIGATDRMAGEAVDRPVTFGEVFSTLYNRLGIDTSAVTLRDLNGRPQYLVTERAEPIRELIG